MNRTQNQSVFSTFFYIHSIAPVSPFGPFYRLKTDKFSYSIFFFTSAREILTALSYTWKRYPFQAEPPRIGHCREYRPQKLLQTHNRHIP